MRSKDLAMVILGKEKKASKSPMKMGVEEEDEGYMADAEDVDDGYLAAAEEVMSALQSGNAEEFAKALKHAISMVQ